MERYEYILAAARTVWGLAQAYPLVTLVLGGTLAAATLLTHLLFGGFAALLLSLVWGTIKLVYYAPLLYAAGRLAWILLRRALRRYNKLGAVNSLSASAWAGARTFLASLPARALAYGVTRLPAPVTAV